MLRMKILCTRIGLLFLVRQDGSLRMLWLYRTEGTGSLLVAMAMVGRNHCTRQGQAEPLVSDDILKASTCCEIELRVWSMDWQVTQYYANIVFLSFPTQPVFYSTNAINFVRTLEATHLCSHT